MQNYSKMTFGAKIQIFGKLALNIFIYLAIFGAKIQIFTAETFWLFCYTVVMNYNHSN